MPDILDACARELLEVMPLVMQDLRRTMRRSSDPDLRVPELRSLAFLRHYPGSNLTDLAEYIGVSLPSMSKLVENLALRGLLDRLPDPMDRRRVRLSLTPEGGNVLSKAREAVKTGFIAKLSRLADEDVTRITTGMALLRKLFEASPETANTETATAQPAEA